MKRCYDYGAAKRNKIALMANILELVAINQSIFAYQNKLTTTQLMQLINAAKNKCHQQILQDQRLCLSNLNYLINSLII